MERRTRPWIAVYGHDFRHSRGIDEISPGNVTQLCDDGAHFVEPLNHISIFKFFRETEIRKQQQLIIWFPVSTGSNSEF